MPRASASYNGLYAAAMVDVTVRPARPEREDGEAFARLFDTAGDGLVRWMLGRNFVAIVAKAFIDPGHDMSHEHVWFAESDGVVLGMVSGYSAAAHRQAKSGFLFRAAGIRAVRLVAVWLVARRLFDFMDRVPDGDWYLQAVAVDPAYRNTGIGSLLLDHAERAAARTQSRRLALDVSVDNDRAIRLYERRGLEIAGTSPSIPFESSSAVHRMTKVL